MKKQTIILLSGLFAQSIYAAPILTPQDKALGEQQLIHQQERQKALEEALAPTAPDISLLPEIQQQDELTFPQESLCFPIQHVQLLERETIPYTIPLFSLTKQAQGHCLGGQGINLLMSALQNRLISHGYITTRVVAPEQDLTSGTLQLLLVKGTVRDVYLSEKSQKHAHLNTIMPIAKDGILNLRDIEQGLENLQRMPTMSAQMQLIPGDKPGESDVVITRNQSKYWRLGLSLDDSGTESTGRYQGGITFYLDNPLSLADSFYVSAGHDIDGDSQYGSKNYLFSYSFPIGYWLFSASKSGNTYHQTVAGSVYDYEYSGRSNNLNFQVSRVIHRNENQKTTLSYGINLKESNNYIDDTEVEVQHRKTTSWQLGINHRHYFGQTTLDLGASYQKGVRWFGAKPAPEEGAGEGSALSDIMRLNASLSVPFTLSEQRLRYDVSYQGQFTRGHDLTSPDRFSIGGRWSVRGFDGELTLSADNGWFVRNELSWATPYGQEFYVGADVGEVSGGNSGYLLGKKLAGGVIGVRGNQFGVYFDGFIGAPLHKPDGFQTDDVTAGFYLSWTY